jgi:hypothetical protein
MKNKKYEWDAMENHPTIFQKIKEVKRKSVNYYQFNFLNYDIHHHKKYDMVCGNPPYFVFKNSEIPYQYRGKKKDKSDTYYEGRIQIFILFLLNSLPKLKEDGILGFILPKSIFNSSYYMKTRKYIYENYEIVDIIDYGNMPFEDTTQETIGLIIQNRKVKNDAFVFSFQSALFFTTQKSELELYYQNASSLYDLGFRVKTGNVVWNQHKTKIKHDNSHPLLLYNTNVGKNEITIKSFSNKEKGQYIDLPLSEVETLPIIVCNRGNGNSEYKMNYAYIDEEVLLKHGIQNGICVENHLNVIYYNREDEVSKEEVKEKMKKLCEIFADSNKIEKWCKIFLGNGGFSKTELESYFPVVL